MTAGLTAFNVGIYRQCTHKIKLAQRSSWANEEISELFASVDQLLGQRGNASLLCRKEQAGRKFQLSRLLVYQAHLFGFFFDSRKWLKSLQELVAARQTEPALLHFEEVLAKLRIRLEPGFVFAMFCAQTALACVLIQNYKHGAPHRRPDTCPNLFPNNLESIHQVTANDAMHTWHESVTGPENSRFMQSVRSVQWQNHTAQAGGIGISILAIRKI